MIFAVEAGMLSVQLQTRDRGIGGSARLPRRMRQRFDTSSNTRLFGIRSATVRSFRALKYQRQWTGNERL
jgi:hypothetical protein